MSQEFCIKLASAKHLPGVLNLYRELHPDIDPLDQVEALDILDRLGLYEGSGVFIGCIGSVVVATCTLVVVPNLTRAGRCYAVIENVVTSQSYRCRGLGGKVVQAAISAAWRRDCYKVMLMTGSKDRNVLRFYEGLGFKASKVGFEVRQAAPRSDR